MNRFTALLLCIFTLCLPSFAQSDLQKSLRHSTDVHIYKLTKKDLDKIYRANESFEEGMLTNFVTKYKFGATTPKLERGNYVEVRVVENELRFESLTIDNLQTKIIPSKDFVICLYDTLGNIITDAEVKIDNAKMKLSAEMKTYSTAKAKDEQVVEINNNGVYHYQNVRNWSSDTYRLKQDKSKNNKYIGFVVFSKPRYKPKETVKLKAYLADKNGKGYDKPIRIKLKGNYSKVDTVLTVLAPYRPGMYSFEFPLTDKLNLTLDKSYQIMLNIPDNKSNTISGYFQYQDYELKSINFSINSDKKEFYTGDTIQIKAKVSNENSMPVYGGKIEVKVKPSYFNYQYSDRIKTEQVLFIPSELWTETFEMKDVAEKTIILPDSIFPKDTSLPFDVECTYWSTDNEMHTKHLSLERSTNKYSLDISIEKGMLYVRELENGQQTEGKTPAKISFKGSNILDKTINLPDTIAVPWVAESIDIETKNSKDSYDINSYQTTNKPIDYQFYRSNDSINLKIDNPAKIPFWYQIEKTSKVIAKGYSTQLDYLTKDTKGEGYRMKLTYLFGGKTLTNEESLPFIRKNITLDIDMPRTAYPGQKVNATVSVVDFKKRPVADVDITAYGFTSKFGANGIPNLPFGGIQKIANKFSTTSYNINGVSKDTQIPFDNRKWLSAFELDTIEYYKFLYPDNFYCYTSKTEDQSTLVSPYIVIDGALQGVEMMWIDNRLYYTNQAQQLQTYTFEVQPGMHNFMFRTYDREVEVKNINLKERTTSVLSFDASKNFQIKQEKTNIELTTKLVDKKLIGAFSLAEMAELCNQLISITNNFGSIELKKYYNVIERPGILKTGNNVYYLNPKNSYNTYYDNFQPIIAGPFPQRSILNGMPNIAAFSIGDSLITNIGIEGGNQYTLYKNFQKLETWNEFVIPQKFDKYKPNLTFNKPSNSRAIIDSVNSYMMTMTTTINGGINIKKVKSDYNLTVNLGSYKNKIQPTLIYFEPQKEDTISGQLYYGGTRDFMLPLDKMTMYLIFSDSTSYQLPISLQKNGKNYLKIDSISNTLPTNDVVRNAYEVFDKNLIRSYYSNPYKGTISDSINQFSMYNNFYLNMGSDVYTMANNDALRVDIAELSTRNYKATTSSAGAPYNTSLLIRGSGSTNSSQKPMVLVDGLPYSGEIGDISPDNILSMNVLKDGEELFGAQAANGVIIITTKSNKSQDALPENMNNSMRRNFHDNAFWQPQLKTDLNGKTSFEIEYPDDITNWSTYFIAIGGKQQYDAKQMNVKSFKALFAQLFTPRFAVRGDSIVNIGKITNYLGDNINALQIVDIDGQKQQKEIALTKSYTSYIPTIANQKDSVKLSYAFQTPNGFFDGEERSYPIVEKGLHQSIGDFKVLNDATTKVLQTDPSKGTITFYAESSSLDLFLNDIQQIDLYPYMCNEQMASKVSALLLREYIYELKGEKFKDKKKIKNLIKDIEKNKNSQKMWGWWSNNQSIFWISKYVINILLDAESAGYDIHLDKESIAQSMISTLDDKLQTIPMLPKDRKLLYRKDEMLQQLEMIYKLGAKIDYAYYFNQINIVLPDTTTKDIINSMYTMSIVGLKDKVDITKLLSLSHQSILGAIYWGDAKSDKNFLRIISPAETNTAITLLAYKTLRNVGDQETTLASIRNYFLEQKNYGGWNNTYESASILSTIIPDMVIKGDKYQASTLMINGKQIDKFPYTTEFSANTKIEVSKTGTQPLFVTAHQSEWNTNPAIEKSKGFKVETLFKQNTDTIANLKEGKPTLLQVNVTLDGDAEYIQLEIPIPAGCSCESTFTNYRKENHREYFKDKVVIFCDRLSKGEHQFEVSLTPRYTGHYTVNPSKIELMYFPTFYGNNGLKDTLIEE